MHTKLDTLRRLSMYIEIDFPMSGDHEPTSVGEDNIDMINYLLERYNLHINIFTWKM